MPAAIGKGFYSKSFSFRGGHRASETAFASCLWFRAVSSFHAGGLSNLLIAGFESIACVALSIQKTHRPKHSHVRLSLHASELFKHTICGCLLTFILNGIGFKFPGYLLP
jgi:hypothetical protein